MTESANRFNYVVRVHIEDTDFSGVVYHANYLRYMERARSEWADEAGVGIDWQRQQGIAFVVHSVEIDFKLPARLHEKIEVVTSISALRNASILYDQRLHLLGTAGKILCRANIKVACVDKDLRPCALPGAPFFDKIRRELT